MVVETVEADIIKCQVSFDSPKEKSTNREGGGGYPNQDHFERFFWEQEYGSWSDKKGLKFLLDIFF